MDFRRNTVAVLCAAAFATLMLPGSGSAATAIQPQQQAASGIAAAAPQPGDCKAGYESATNASAPAAQAMWTAIVAAKFGNNWANWVGARNRQTVPLGNGQVMVRAQPCFYYPVQ